jgi:hypothetical protein
VSQVTSKNQLLHILRNPYGWPSETVREARLWAADIIERLPEDATKPPTTERPIDHRRIGANHER